jgi:ABC-type nitrate/sulfonate/bicarbonate transport system substrate-binding protein
VPGRSESDVSGPAVRLGFVANPFSLPFARAVDRSYFDQAGLAVTVERFANGSAVSAALAEGTIDAGVSGHLQTLLAGVGADRQVFVAPLGFEEAPDHLPITLLGAPGVSDAHGLEGHQVAVSALGAISELQLRIFMEASGADYRSLRLAAMPFGEMGEALSSGRVGAASVPEPFASTLIESGVGHLLDRGSLSRGLHAGERAMIAGLAAKASWVSAHPEAVSRVTDALGRAIDDLAGDGGEAAAMLAGLTAAATPIAGMQTPAFDRHLEAPDLQRVFDLALKHGLLGEQVDGALLLA